MYQISNHANAWRECACDNYKTRYIEYHVKASTCTGFVSIKVFLNLFFGVENRSNSHHNFKTEWAEIKLTLFRSCESWSVFNSALILLSTILKKDTNFHSLVCQFRKRLTLYKQKHGMTNRAFSWKYLKPTFCYQDQLMMLMLIITENICKQPHSKIKWFFLHCDMWLWERIRFLKEVNFSMAKTAPWLRYLKKNLNFHSLICQFWKTFHSIDRCMKWQTGAFRNNVLKGAWFNWKVHTCKTQLNVLHRSKFHPTTTYVYCK